MKDILSIFTFVVGSIAIPIQIVMIAENNQRTLFIILMCLTIPGFINSIIHLRYTKQDNMKDILEFLFVGSLLFAAACCIILIYLAPIFFLVKMVVIPLLIAAIAWVGTKMTK